MNNTSALPITTDKIATNIFIDFVPVFGSSEVVVVSVVTTAVEDPSVVETIVVGASVVVGAAVVGASVVGV